MSEEPGGTDPAEQPMDIHAGMPGGRMGWSLRQRIAAPDSYGLLLLLILLSMLSIAALSDTHWERSLSSALLAFTLLFALHTSRAPHRVLVTAYIVVPLLVITAVIATIDGSTQASRVLTSALVLLLLLAVLAAVLLRMGTHLTISWATILAGICIYLLVGLIFGSLFSLLGAIDDGVLFAGGQPASTLNTTYFSFVTIATVGYGDLTMADGFTKMLSATEAVLGQIYLVVAVGLLIGNLGRERRRRRPVPPPG